jgi:DNA-directed RNA polymerase subunit L
MQPESTTPDLLKDPAILAIAPTVERIRTFANGLAIRSQEGYEKAANALKAIKREQDNIEAARVKITKPINEGLRAINAQAKIAAKPLIDSEFAIKAAMRAYIDAEEEKRRQEQRRLDEQAEADRRRLLEAAERNEAKGKENKADEFRERAQAVVAPIVQREAPKAAGITTSKVWKFEIVDPTKINAPFMMPNEVAIRKTVLALGEQAPSVIGEGVRVRHETQIGAARE